MTGDELSVEDEFKALVEACHCQDIKVIIDLIPRTNSVNSDLIAEHPDWFYWIEADQLDTYTRLLFLAWNRAALRILNTWN